MKPHSHPRITVTGIILSFLLNAIGAFMLKETGDATLLFVGIMLFALVSIDIVIDRNRRLVTVFNDLEEE